MASEARSVASGQPEDSHWKWLLLTLWAITFALTLAAIWTHLGSAAWLGFWDMDFGPAGPYTVEASDPRAGGAASNAGIRKGDRFDLREQDLNARLALLSQPNRTVPIVLIADRSSRTIRLRFVGSSAWEGARVAKVGNQLIIFLSGFWFLGCALLIAVRRSNSADGRILGLVLILMAVASAATPSTDFRSLFPPNPIVRVSADEAQNVCFNVASILLVGLTARFGRRYAWRAGLERCTYAIIAFGFLGGLAYRYSVLTVRADPTVFISGSFWTSFYVVYNVAVAAVATAAVACTKGLERPRAAWLLVPLPFALLAVDLLDTLIPFVTSWLANISIAIAANFTLLLAAMLVTYALLKRRVLDFEFVLSRTLVFAIISLIIVASFVLLEWVLGSALAGVSHATGLIANGGLALALGLSMHYIHNRVDAFVDAVFFRKRYENERALRDFSKEAAFVTDPGALLDQAVEKLRNHTDARAAALFIRHNGSYRTAREFGATCAEVGENDPAILALKTWHKPLDPHHYTTALHGALAVPMVSRGQLLGVLLCGERAGGEAYVPDEVEALADFAHGVGAAFDGLADGASRAAGDDLLSAIRELRESNAAELRELRRSIERRFP